MTKSGFLIAPIVFVITVILWIILQFLNRRDSSKPKRPKDTIVVKKK